MKYTIQVSFYVFYVYLHQNNFVWILSASLESHPDIGAPKQIKIGFIPIAIPAAKPIQKPKHVAHVIGGRSIRSFLIIHL